MEEFSREVFDRWKSHPVTAALFRKIQDWVDENQDEWRGGAWVNPNDVAATGLRATILLRDIKVLENVLEVCYDDLIEKGDEDGADDQV